MSLLFRIACLGCALAIVPALATAAATDAVEPASKPLRVGICPKSPPMIFKEAGRVTGVEADFAQALGQALGRRVVFVEEDWERLIDSLCEDRVDIIMSGMSITPARRYRVAFTNPYLKVGQMALARSGEKYSYLLNLASQAEHGVGVKAGTTADFLLQQEFPKLKRKYYKNGDDAAVALTKKKIDLFISDSPMIWRLAALNETKGLTIVPMVLTQEELAWAVRRGDTELQQSANSFLQKALDSGGVSRILSQWMPGFR